MWMQEKMWTNFVIKISAFLLIFNIFLIDLFVRVNRTENTSDKAVWGEETRE